MMKLPDHLFFTGAPGSRWSSIAKTLEIIPGVNTSDHRRHRVYAHDDLVHAGAYFGEGMEYEAAFIKSHIDSAWAQPGGCKIVKSHEWAYDLNNIRQEFPTAWIMLVYRPDMASYAWWHEAGGFNITYPNYSRYRNSAQMLGDIAQQNDMILKFAHQHDLTWNYFTTDWIEKTFGHHIVLGKSWSDVLVTVLK